MASARLENGMRPLLLIIGKASGGGVWQDAPWLEQCGMDMDDALAILAGIGRGRAPMISMYQRPGGWPRGALELRLIGRLIKASKPK